MKTLTSVVSMLTYLSPEGSPPSYISGEPGEEEKQTGQYDQVAVVIHNARKLSRAPQLEVDGFCLIKHVTNDVDFYSKGDVTTNYYPQVASLLKAELGADHVIVFDHNVRIDAERPGLRQPARHVHSDYTVRSALRRVIEVVDSEDVIRRLGQRIMQVNLWRPLEHPVFTSPLALAAAPSIKADDYVRADIIYPSWKGEILELMHSPLHQWFYFPDMTPDEALIFRGFDSHSTMNHGFTPHSAFKDPTSPADAKPRISIELRALAFM